MDKLTYGECRCCLAKGKHRDINKEYYLNGTREVFIQDFIECFNLFLATEKNLTALICKTCVSRLRDAREFRSQVVNTEKKLLKCLEDGDENSMVFVNVPTEDGLLDADNDIKKEENSDDDIVYNCDYEPQEYDTEDMDFMVDSHKNYDLVEGEKELLSRFSKGSMKPLPTRESLRETCPNYVRHLDILKGIILVPNMLKKYIREKKCRKTIVSGNVYITEKVGQVVNVATLLEHSNMTPFKSRGRKGFLCFYCPNIFDDPSKLREHTLQHDKGTIQKILKTYVAESLVVNADVSDLKCVVCEGRVKDLADLKSHLIRVHKKRYYTEFTDRIVPYKLSGDNIECQVCGVAFETFGAIERHMNVHFRNYICKECGNGFVTKARLKVHYTNSHVGGAFPCEHCGKMFTSQLKHKNHIDSVHRMRKRFKCNKCPERFTEYVYRQRHLVEVHGVPPIQYKCNVCEKTFSRRYNLSLHMKRDHLEERDFGCAMCSYKCFSSKQLSMHMVKHNGERIFECSVCKKAYARKKTLSEHMRIHNNDKRFACAICGQAFVQKCSLKGHMKTHHTEYGLS